MVSNKTNAVMINKEDIEQLLVEWNKVPTWIKIHVSVRQPAHRCEGQLFLQDETLVFRGRDMKEGRDYLLEIPLEAITEVKMGFDGEEGVRIAFDFGTAGFEPFGVRYQVHGENHTVYFNIYPDNYPPHINFNNRKWCQMLEKMITGNRASEPIETRHHVLTGIL